MAFVLAPKDTIRTKVQIVEPVDDDKTKVSEISVRFKKLTVSDFQKLSREAADEENPISWADLLRENITDVEGLVDADNEPIDFDVSVLDQLLDLQYVFAPLLEAFVSISTGEREAERRKNLSKRGSNGR